MTKAILTSMLLAFTSIVGFSQTRYFQEYGKNRVLTEAEFNLKKEIYLHNFRKVSSDVVLKDSVAGSRVAKDSIITTHKLWVVVNRSMTILITSEQEKVYDMVGRQLPEFSLYDYQGKVFTSDMTKGKPLVINFWFNGCSPCKKEMPTLNEIKRSFGDRVQFLSVTFNTRDEVAAFLKLNRFDFHHLVDAKDLVRKFGLTGYPKTILVDKHGKITQVMECIESKLDQAGNVVIGDGGELVREIKRIL